ncbi:MAG: hypothetical protein GXY34_07010 [Syntrophomonadaceae bacterium]|nr:hypothetical protein [Syntrophomonadaceae bacterium]
MNQNLYNIPLTLPVTAQDRFMYPMKAIIHVVVSFDQHLDVGILQRAVRLSLDTEPVLGCRFVEEDPQPRWQRFENLDEMQWLACTSPDNLDEAIDRFIKDSFFHEEQQLNVGLFQTEGGDTLVVKISHTCSDAGGLKDYLQLLAGIYTRLQDNPDYYPPPHTSGCRDQQHYFTALGINDPLAGFDPQAPATLPNWAFPHHSSETNQIHTARRRLKNEALDRIITFAKDHNVTVTAVLLTAMFRSLFEMLESPWGEEFGMGVSMDLRNRFSGKPDQAICPLSLGINPCITCLEEESFEETLQRASEALEELKQNHAELVDAIAVEAWAKLDYSAFLAQIQAILQWVADTGKSNPLLSNIGVIDPLNFSQTQATDIYLLTPVVIPPAFVLGVTTYNRTLTLQCTFGEPGHSKEDIEGFIDLMEKELLHL